MESYPSEQDNEGLLADSSFVSDHEIYYDHEYAAKLNERLQSRFGPVYKRTAVHASDLLMCLRKAHGRIRAARGDLKASPDALAIDDTPEDDALLTWAGGLQFEDLVSEGEKQPASAWCWTCRTVSSVPPTVPGGEERTTCSVCGEAWIVFTPDYIVDGIIHESKQTRKSQRQGPQGAPWWIDQLRTYLAFMRRAGRTQSPYGRLVVNWLMGSYGERKKGRRPIPPRSALDPFRVVFREGFEAAWLSELWRRQGIVEGEEMPSLDFKDSPRYSWECASCRVGPAIKCPGYIWDEEGNEAYPYSVMPINLGVEDVVDTVQEGRGKQ